MIQKLASLQDLYVLDSIVYVFIYEEKQNIKSAKWVIWDKHEIFTSYDGGIIYRIYLQDKEKIILIKYLKIFENVDKKQDSQVNSYDTYTDLKQKPKINILSSFSSLLLIPTLTLI